MVYIFHGDNITQSRTAFLSKLNSFSDCDILRLDPKNIDLDIINNFLQGNSLFAINKVLSFENFFSVHKATQDKILKLLNSSDAIETVLWQDKTLTAVQLKVFPKAVANLYKLDNKLYACLDAIKPHNLQQFLVLYREVVNLDLYDLFLYLLKGSLRRQLISYTKLDTSALKRAYLQLIELDFQNKSGLLTIPKEIALERIMLNLLK